MDNYNLVKLLILASTILKPNIKSPLNVTKPSRKYYGKLVNGLGI